MIRKGLDFGGDQERNRFHQARHDSEQVAKCPVKLFNISLNKIIII